jgi:hypothetical protein
MARGTLKSPLKKQEETPMKQVSGAQIGTAAGAVIGSVIPGVGTAIGGAVGGVLGGLFDSGGKKKQPSGPSAAERALARRRRAYENMQFETTNPYEDVTVNLQAAEFQRQQQAQEQADILAGLQTAAGGAGAASLATAMARQSQAKQQQIAADIGKQEAIIQQAAAQAEMRNQEAKRQFEIGRMETLLGMDMAAVTGEQQARLAAQQQKTDIMGGVLGLAGEILPAVIGAGTSPTTNTTTSNTTQFADLSNLSIDTSGLGQNLSLTQPSSGLSLS